MSWDSAVTPVPSGVTFSGSAMYNIDDAGGFDRYILDTPPQELRSTLAEKLKMLVRFREDAS